MKSSIRAALAVGALALASSQAFASTVNVTNGMTPVVVNTFSLPTFDPREFELNVGPAGSGSINTIFTLLDTDPEQMNVSYSVYADTNAALNSWTTGALIDSWTVADLLGNGTTAHLTALLANTQYVLSIATNGAYSSSTQISAVPLPAAAWLFGSALLGLGALRRKQKAGNDSEMALA